ncbi:hypothetical protein DPMN_018573 [Dreissena polymorpha]|uniref:Uncharacterized protein n=1 Tax=Dreissena polymorpha TaxID=45954 RepID=A0A9D4NHI9_DREPO|nr:hypothetical protein DPMN_018573 [Dreissena polymorpha]
MEQVLTLKSPPKPENCRQQLLLKGFNRILLSRSKVPFIREQHIQVSHINGRITQRLLYLLDTIVSVRATCPA